MRFSIVLLALFALVFNACKNDQQLSLANEIIKEIKEKHAPDPRVAFFNLSAELQAEKLIVKGMTIAPEAHQALFERLEQEKIRAVDSVEVLPSPALEGKLFGVVNVSVSNIRSQPKNSAEMATQALLGTPLRVWKEEGGYYLVQTPDDYFGWLDSGGFSLMDESSFQSYLNSERLICTKDFDFAYSAADENSQVVSDLVAGCILQNIENQGNFIKMKFPDGRTAFVKSSNSSPLKDWLASRQPDATHILATAKQMMGRPYLWGGTSGKGMDCSGFTKTVFYLNGLQLPRDASQQVHAGEAIDTDTTLKNLQVGDLLFFGRKATENQKERITHVAIYMGDGKIIHASNMVELGSLRRGDPDFQEGRLNSLVKGRRMIGTPAESGAKPLANLPFYAQQQLPD